MARFRYILFLLILIVPAAAVDDAIGSIESFGIRYALRVLWILIVFMVLRIVPK